MAKLAQKFIRVFTVDRLTYGSLKEDSSSTTVGISTDSPLYIHLNNKVINRDGTFAMNADGTFVLDENPLPIERQSQSYMLDLIHEIETKELGISYIPVKSRPSDMTFSECIRYNSAYQEHVIQTLVSFKFGRRETGDEFESKVVEDALNVNGICLQRFLPNGDVEEVHIGRFLRTSSHSRAGGAWYSSRVEDYTRIFTYGQETPETPIFSAPAKWDSRKALVSTTSLPIPLGDNAQVGICVVDDITRLISTKVVSIAKGENQSPLAHLDGYAVKYKLNKETGVDEFEYEVSEPFSKSVDSTLTDGTAICTPELMAKIAVSLGAVEKEEEYLHAIQLRAPWMKGMLAEFDILGWCKTHNITHMRDVYGHFHAIEDIQMVVPKSVFKCWNLYMTKGISSLYDIINGEFELNDNTYKYFKDGAFLRAASVNKSKKEFNPMTYQYLQALVNLEPESLNGKADVLFNLVEEAMLDISKAKAVLGMSQSSEDYDYDTITSKACHLLEMCPESFNTRFIKAQIIKTVRTMLEKQAKGRVMEEGSYHFLLPDLTTFFAKEVYRETASGSGDFIALGVDQEAEEYRYTEVSMEECHNYTISATDRCGILDKGFAYMFGEDRLAVAFRSPLIHMAEPQKLNFNVGDAREELDKWFGQLKGCTIFNSYELVALAMGGADFDGDKIFISFDPLLIAGVMTKEDGTPLDIVVSPLEGLNASTVQITPSAMFEVDKRSMDNKTGYYTDIATFYMNYYYHVNYASKEFLAKIEDPTVSLASLYAQFNEFFPSERVDITLFTRAFAKRRVEELRTVKLRDIEKAITIARIASAGEIDFPKHGMRFPMSKSVTTNKRAVWHKYPNRVFLESELAKKQECGWGAKEYEFYVGDVKVTVVDFKTPMQMLSNHVYSSLQSMDSKLTTSGSLKLIDAIITDNKESLEVVAYSTQLKSIYDEYVVETNRIRAEQKIAQLPEKEIGEIYGAFYNRMGNKTAVFANRKALAEACLSICAGTKSDNFAFVCAFDGILEILSERATQTVRVAEIEVPNYVSTITVALEGKVGSYTSTHGAVETVELPVVLSTGEYKVIDTLNKRYVTFAKYLSKEEITNHLESARRAVSKEHHVKLVVDRQYKVGITGLSHTGIAGFDATRANELIVKNNNTIMFKEYTFLNEKGVESVGVGVWVGDIRVGKLSSLDENQVTDESMVKFKSLYNSPFKIDIVSDSLYKKVAVKDVNGDTVKDENGRVVRAVDYGKPNNGFNAVVTVASMSPITYNLDKIHNTCDLNQWYWNVEWKKFGELGFEFLGVEIGQAIQGRTIGRVQLRQNGVVFQADVTYVGGSIGLALASFSDGYNLYSVEDIYRTKRDLLAQILRCVAYSYKKATYVEPIAEKSEERIEWEQQMQVKQEAYMVEIARREEEKKARIQVARDNRIKEAVAKRNAEWKAKCEEKGKRIQAKRNAEFQAEWKTRQALKKNKGCK